MITATETLVDSAPEVPSGNPSSAGPTGPRTPAGKARSSRNAITHALSVASPDRLPEPLRAEYLAFRDSLFPEIHPRTELEQIQFERYAHCAFQLLRGQQMEHSAMQKCLDSDADPAALQHLSRLARYLRGLERSAAAALAEYRRLAANRLALAEVQCLVTDQYDPEIRIPNALPLDQILDKKHFRPQLRDVAFRASLAYRQNDTSQPRNAEPELQQ